VNLFFIIYWN